MVYSRDQRCLPSCFPRSQRRTQTYNSPCLLDLPPEVLLHLIHPYLSYPDLLALKHTHPIFFHSLKIKVRHRVDWLLDRATQHLPLPYTNSPFPSWLRSRPCSGRFGMSCEVRHASSRFSDGATECPYLRIMVIPLCYELPLKVGLD